MIDYFNLFPCSFLAKFNPNLLSSLIPLVDLARAVQNNTIFNFGPLGKNQNVLNIQPDWSVRFTVQLLFPRGSR